MTPTGRARVEQEVVDMSVLYNTALQGVSAVIGVTEKGKVGESILVGSWNEYVRHFGGLLPLEASKFPAICKRILEAGGRIRVARVKETAFDATGKLIKQNALLVNARGVKVMTSKLADMAGNGTTVDIKNGTMVLLSKDGKVREEYPFKDTSVATINTDSKLVKIETAKLVTELEDNTVYELSNGTDGTLTDADFIGDPVKVTGLHVFDGKADFVKVAVPERATKEIDLGLVAYVESRKDCRAILRTPEGLTGLEAITYRESSKIDSWWADMYYGDIITPNAENVRNPIVLPAIGDVLGALSVRDDRAKAWLAVGGPKRGKIRNTLGVVYNLGTPARATEFDQVSNAGINAIIDDADYGTVIWDNVTMQKAKTLLSHSNIADLLVYLSRAITPLVKSELFEPNDVETWSAIYRKVRPILEACKEGRGIWDYKYEGDQFVDSIEEATINDPNNVDAGMYEFIIWLKPKAALKYAKFSFVVTNSGVSFEEVL